MPCAIIGRRRIRSAALMITTALTCIAPYHALAQTITPAQGRESVDQNGVDLISGTLRLRSPTLSIGSGSHELKYDWLWNGNGWSQSLSATMFKNSASQYTISVGSQSDVFDFNGSVFTARDGNGSTLIANSASTYIYKDRNGTTVEFTTTKVRYTGYHAVANSITFASGKKLTYGWTEGRYCSRSKPGGGEGYICLQYDYAYRPASVSNSANYKVIYEYVNDILEDIPPDFTGWFTQTGTSAYNYANGNYSPSSRLGTSVTASGGYSYRTFIDPAGNYTVYRSNGPQILGIKRPGSSVEDVTFSYNNGRINYVVSPAGTTTYSFSDSGNVRTVTVANTASQVTTYTFDIAQQRMTSMTDPTGKQTTWQIDGFGRVTRETDPEGNYKQISYDARGNVVEERLVAKTPGSPGDVVTSYAYDGTCSNTVTCNRPKSMTDARGAVTDYNYDATHGGLISVTSPPAANGIRPQTRYGYAGFSAPSGGGTVYELATISTCRTAPPGSCANGSDETRLSISYELGNLRPVSETISSGDNILSATTSKTYDTVGNLTLIDGPLPGSADTTKAVFDANRRITLQIGIDPDGSGVLRPVALRRNWDAKGRLTTEEYGTSDGNGQGFQQAQMTSYIYDAADRQTSSSVYAGGAIRSVTQSSYDTAGRLNCSALRMNAGAYGSLPASACTIGSTGSAGDDRITRYLYDDAGRIISVTTGYGTTSTSTETKSYTINGKVASVADGNGNITKYSYDSLDRLWRTCFQISESSSCAGTPSDYEQLTYDPSNNVRFKRLRDGTAIEYQYDNLNRITSEILPNGQAATSYIYNLFGSPTNISRSDGMSQTINYDALGRVTSDGQPNGSISYQYDAAGRRVQMSWSDGFSLTYEYLPNGAMSRIRETGATSGLGVLATFVYDELGRRKSLTRGNGTVTNYNYSPAMRLDSLGLDLAGTNYDQTYGFSYNPANQIASRSSTNDAYNYTGTVNVDRSYEVNGLNQFATAGLLALSHDLRGNLTTAGPNQYSYNSKNQLISANLTVGATTVSYDGLGRAMRVVNAVDNRYVYDGANIATHLSMASGAAIISRRFVWGPKSDEIISTYEGAGTAIRRWPISDERGSVVVVTDDTGNAVAFNKYDEFGVPSAITGEIGYAGQLWIDSLGLSYNKSRFYSPSLGRFMQVDPTGYADGINWYNYVGSDPINFVDGSGLKKVWAPCPTNDCVNGNPGGGNLPGGGERWKLLPQSGRYGHPYSPGRQH